MGLGPLGVAWENSGLVQIEVAPTSGNSCWGPGFAGPCSASRLDSSGVRAPNRPMPALTDQCHPYQPQLEPCRILTNSATGVVAGPFVRLSVFLRLW